MTPAHAFFYHQTTFAVLSWWSLIFLLTRKQLHEITASSVITRPSWLPIGFLLFLQRHRAEFFYGEIVGLLVSCAINTLPSRVFTAVTYTLYHLTESSMTNRHGEYPILYIMWANCVPNEEYATAAALAVTVNFVLSTGYAKIQVGGLKEWIDPRTMRTYLQCYRQSHSSLSRPLCPSWNKAVCSNNKALSLMSACTLFLECVLVPGALFLPALRKVACCSMVLMHVGIALLMSLKVGSVFITSLPAYLYGFNFCEPIGSIPWMVAVSIGLLPMIVSLAAGSSVIPENWPFTPVSLFMWSYRDAKSLLDSFMVGDKRMVLTTASCQRKDLVGRLVLPHGPVVADVKDEFKGHVHDGLMRTFGFTIIQGGRPFVKLVQQLRLIRSGDGLTPEMQLLVGNTQQWLQTEKRLWEAATGELLTQAYFVRVDGAMRIVEVHCGGDYYPNIVIDSYVVPESIGTRSVSSKR